MESKMKSQIFSGLIWKFAERFFAEIVTFVVSIVLARLLMPEDYGAIALVNLSAKSTRTLEITLNLSKKIPNVLSIRKQIERPETY